MSAKATRHRFAWPSIIEKLLSIDIDKLSISDAFDLLFDIQNSFKTLYLGGLNYEEKI